MFKLRLQLCGFLRQLELLGQDSAEEARVDHDSQHPLVLEDRLSRLLMVDGEVEARQLVYGVLQPVCAGVAKALLQMAMEKILLSLLGEGVP
jgi:hypothetical protein